MSLRVLCDKIVQLDKSLATIFIDYSAVFDSVSHKFVDKALKEAGVSPKIRGMCRAIYKAVSAFTSVRGSGDKQIICEVFPINRGVLQGDVIPPSSSSWPWS